MHADKHVLFKINKLATVQVGAPLRVQTECYNYASGLFCQNFLTSSQHLKKKEFSEKSQSAVDRLHNY